MEIEEIEKFIDSLDEIKKPNNIKEISITYFVVPSTEPGKFKAIIEVIFVEAYYV